MSNIQTPSQRLVSLDAFRGLTIAAMILVNNPGTWDSVYAPLLHAKWWGITPTDMIPSSFLFIVGVAVAFAYTKLKAAGKAPRDLYAKIIIRAIKIFAVGMFLNAFWSILDGNFPDMRWTGTLHRIAFVFLGCGITFLHTSWRTQAIIGGSILLLYYMVMVFIPTPGVGKVTIEPGINIAHWIDNKLLIGKMWQVTWDPEGVVANIASFVTGLSGMLAGTYLLSKDSWERKVINLLFVGGLSIILGILWGWGSMFGVNANLWSPAYILISSGFAASVLAGCIYVVDILGKKNNAIVDFGVIYGVNAIAVYVLADLMNPFFYNIPICGMPLNELYLAFATKTIGLTAKFASMTYALFYIFVCFVPAYILNKKKIYIKL